MGCSLRVGRIIREKAVWVVRASLAENLDVADEDAANLGKIPSYFVARHFISRDREKGCGAVAQEKKA
jgi:hypothetical protein